MALGIWAVSQAAGPAPGQLTEQTLGGLLAQIGLKPQKVEQRYDFSFKAVHQGQEWEMSMTAVLSRDGRSLWVMAWLDEIPAGNVPSDRLLRLLAANDELGNGKFFAYVHASRRLILQRVIPNNGIDTATMIEILKDLSRSVIETYPLWATQRWQTPQTQPVSNRTVPNGVNRPARFAVPPALQTSPR
ncbi:MAG: hypothetical protein D6725_10800 [Planctomycetota bacterium]|nr:MAG: hypothetical protein D6725_10800 [Planctomycetota bacterium]